MKRTPRKIILASSSPRRIELLKQAGLRVLVQKPLNEEKIRRGESPKEMVSRLAREKAESVAFQHAIVKTPTLVIGSDTTVVAPESERILGKPRNHAEACKMLKLLSGKTHTVHTAYAVVELLPGAKPRTHIRVVSTRVKMRQLTEKQIRSYVATGEPMDKAGSYAAQGIGMCMIEQISGSYTNVVGLPMAQLLQDLETKFDVPLSFPNRNE